MSEKRFNIRVYGVCINDRNEVLLSDEQYRGQAFTKFPGGGLDWGEGTKDCLIREFQEEFELEIAVDGLFYFTDFFQQSAFSANDQVISVYYTIRIPEPVTTHALSGDKGEVLRWQPLAQFAPEQLTFPIDKVVARLILQQCNTGS